MHNLRTGAEYREALRDGRKVWVVGEGRVDDVTTHPATRAMVDEYVAWYDRHFDAAWQDRLLTPTDAAGRRIPWGYVLPRTSQDLVAMGRSFAATTFLSAGNITHTPAYGCLIALGVLGEVQEHNPSQQQIDNALAYRDEIARTGRFLTFSSGAATIGARMKPDPKDRASLRIVRETDSGLVISGKVGMHTSPAYAEEVYVGGLCGVEFQGHRATFIVPVGAPGVTVICRRTSVHHPSTFLAPLSSRYDELDGQMWLENVFIPWERVFLTEPIPPERIARWLFWHQLYCWLSKAEFTLGLALACSHAIGLAHHEPTINYLLDLMTDVQTVRSCQVAAERDPQFTIAGYCYPNLCHLSAGSMAMLRARPGMSEMLRIVPGSSLVVAPGDADLADPEVAAGLEESFSGGGYSALQRSALLQMAWDHVSSMLDARESAFELHANGGIPAWRGRLRRGFEDYNRLANAVLKQLDIPMPEIDLSHIRTLPMAPRRVVEVPPQTANRSEGKS
ncbi:MAG TPA: 4-hydroxyphenylacetate 3-hydroxylase N-terminal domain-containing protein [Acetobacteraceae bacterium]|nr:4-hydroxyphenylacetate 3-hydroxylase N-terminal domain-containing protein [Acetobacteraceae bacterium]